MDYYKLVEAVKEQWGEDHELSDIACVLYEQKGFLDNLLANTKPSSVVEAGRGRFVSFDFPMLDGQTLRLGAR